MERLHNLSRKFALSAFIRTFVPPKRWYTRIIDYIKIIILIERVKESMKKLLMTTLVMMLAVAAVAQEENLFTIDAQLRTRGEYNNGALYPRSEGQKPATYIDERARVSMDFQRGALELKVSAQHTGIWGQDGMNTANGRMTMNEAWAKLKFGENWFAQIGRQQLSYDDERILGGLDWNVNGNWHDALRLGYEKDAHKIHAILAMNQNGANRGNYYESGMPYKAMLGLWYHYQAKTAPLGISLLGLNVGYEQGEPGNGKTKYMQTFGTDVTYKPGKWDLHGAFYFQTGTTAADLTACGLMGSLKAGYQINPQWKASLGFDYLSGEDYEGSVGNREYGYTIYKTDEGKSRAFNPLYGTHHKFYGSMDYFYASAYLNGLAVGLQDIQAGVDFKASEKTSLMLNYHYFATASELAVEMLDKGLGHELDFQLTTKLMKDVTLTAGYSFMIGTETMDCVKGGDHDSWQDWAWVSLNISPRIFSTKW